MPKDRRSSLTAKLFIGLAIGLAAIALPLYGYKVWLKTDYTDFSVYYRAGARWLAHTYSEIYSLADGTSPMRYAPIFLPFFSLFAHFERSEAQVAWYVLQFFSFAWGLWILRKTLRISGAPSQQASFAVAVAFLMTLRPILDSFTIGQISGFMFLAFAAALWGFVRKRPWILALGSLFPAWLKIGPGILLFLSIGVRDPRRGWIKTALPLVILSLLAAAIPWLTRQDLWNWQSSTQLWGGWIEMIRKDSEYYDSSHYGSQSLNSVLLRLTQQGLLNPHQSDILRWALSITLIVGLLMFWWTHRPRNGLARTLFFSQGLLTVMLLMPETFKYSLTPIAIPLAAFWVARSTQSRLSPLAWISLALTFLFISIPGKDLVGDWIFFSIQRLNLPFVAIATLFAAVSREAYLRSHLSTLGAALHLGTPEEWDRTPESSHSDGPMVFVFIPLESDSRISTEHVRRAIAHLSPFSAAEVHPELRLTLVPWGNRAAMSSPALLRLQKAFPSAQTLWIPNAHTINGAQIWRQAALLIPHSVGIYLNLEQIPDGASLLRAWKNPPRPGNGLVWSRRAPGSQLEFNGRSLSIAYRRYRSGLRLQRMLSHLPGAPTQARDLQSDAWQMHRRDFLRAASLAQLNQGLAPTELRLLCVQLGISLFEDSAHFLIADEKSGSRMVREILSILRSWLHLLFQPRPSLPPLADLPYLTADDWGLSAGVNEGILSLVRQGVLKRVSVMAHGEALQEGLSELLTWERKGAVQLGLHLDLTYAPRYRKLLRSGGSPARALLGWLLRSSQNRTALAREALTDQLQTLRAHGIAVRYLDGHHHVHLLPGLLEAIAPLLHDASILSVRIPTQPGRWFGGRAPIHLLAWRAGRLLHTLRLMPTASEFIYPRFFELKNRWKLRLLLQKHPDAEVLTHPAAWNDLDSLQTPEPHYQSERIIEAENLALIPLWQETPSQEASP